MVALKCLSKRDRMIFKHEWHRVEKCGVEKFMVEKNRVEKFLLALMLNLSGVEAWG